MAYKHDRCFLSTLDVSHIVRHSRQEKAQEIGHELGVFVSAFTLFVAGFSLSLCLFTQPSFSLDPSSNTAIVAQQHRVKSWTKWPYKKIALTSVACTICVISATISPTLGICTTSAAALSIYYYCRSKSPAKSEVVYGEVNKAEDPPYLPPPPGAAVIEASCENVEQPMPFLRSRSFKELNKPLIELQISLLNGAIEGLNASTIESMASIFAAKRTLNGITIDYQRIIKNTKEFMTQLLQNKTEYSFALKAELENFFRHFNVNDIVNKRIIVFLLLTTNTLSATEQEYIIGYQEQQALASYFSRLIIKFKELETGKGVSAEGIGVLSLKTLKTEYRQLSHYVDTFSQYNEISEEEVVKLAEQSFQITHIAREDHIKKIFQEARNFDEAVNQILQALKQQSNKEQTWHTVVSCSERDSELKVFNLEGFYKVTPFKGNAAEVTNILTAHSATSEEKFYLRIWKNNNFLSQHLLDPSNEHILKAIEDGRYKLMAIAFGKEKLSSKRGYYLFPTISNVPRLAQHQEIIEPIIYRLHSPYKNTEENLTELNKLLSRLCQ